MYENKYRKDVIREIRKLQNMNLDIFKIEVSPEVWEIIKDKVKTFYVGSKTKHRFLAYPVVIVPQMKGRTFTVVIRVEKTYDYSL